MPQEPTQTGLTTAAAIGGWPPDRPLAFLGPVNPDPRRPGGAESLDSRYARWSIAAEPTATFRVRRDASGRPRSEWVEARTGHSLPPPASFTHDPIADLRAILAAFPERKPGLLPFQSGWIGYLSYDLGRFIEPAAGGPNPPPDDRGWSLVELHRCEGAYVFDLSLACAFESGERGRVPTLEELEDTAWPVAQARAFEFRSNMGRERFEAAAARAIEYIRAGDVFQVNLAHRLSAPFVGSARGSFLGLCGAAAPWYGAYLESPPDHGGGGVRRALLSMSPELLLDFNPQSRRLTTRPMKGTRPAAGNPEELFASDKDRAELNMIIDLMRNDLGRVSRFRSVAVAEARAVERHGGRAGGVWQAVATVRGHLRFGLGLADVLAAVFPGGSVTGAPKIRAMQIIDELEPVARGPYCGSVGYISDCGRAVFNVAIRTALVTGAPDPAGADRFADGVIDYSVGAGIVADSQPHAEWKETLDKAGVLRQLPVAPV